MFTFSTWDSGETGLKFSGLSFISGRKKKKHLCFAIKNAETQLNLAEFCLLCIQKQELGLRYFHVCARG